MLDNALKRLNDFLRDQIYYNHRDINAGGCCVLAAILAPYLMKVGTVRIRVESGGWGSSKSIDEARKKVKRNTVREWNDRGVVF